MDRVEASRGLQRIFRPIRQRIGMMVRRGVVRLVNDDAMLQELQLSVLKGEVLGRAERFQEYGFTSNPLKGAEAIVLAVSGTGSHRVVVAVDDRRHRPKGLQPGEVAVYDDLGKTIVFKRNGTLEITAPKVVFETTGDVEVNAQGDCKIDSQGKVVVEAANSIHLDGEGGPAVARVGDRVNVSSGSSAGQWPIIEGSSKVKCN